MHINQPITLAVLVSGNGSNLQAIIDRIEAGEINARIACVISNSPDAFALQRAAGRGITTIIHENRLYSDRRDYDAVLVGILKRHKVELIVMAGFMRILSDVMISAFPNAIINIHPSLLPAFPGLNAQKKALDYGVRFSGCTVHFVDNGTDSGPIILQAVVPVMQNDTVAHLSERILKEEHEIYPEVIRLFADGRISIQGRRVTVRN
jgi:phosphoribosylglycinamide formyltransferase 1